MGCQGSSIRGLLNAFHTHLPSLKRRNLCQAWNQAGGFPQPNMELDTLRRYIMPPPCSSRWHQEIMDPVMTVKLDMSILNSSSEIFNENSFDTMDQFSQRQKRRQYAQLLQKEEN
ncbi:hypothetical protein MC885_002927 [Smutsia gigantea]|nr:hypothetical protein MC885_002927 [Smutsia gigantea]